MTDPQTSSDSTCPENPTINRLEANLLEDQKRVKVKVGIQNPISRPDLELILEDAQGQELARSLLMGVFSSSAEFTLHIRDDSALTPYKLRALLKTGEEKILSERSTNVT